MMSMLVSMLTAPSCKWYGGIVWAETITWLLKSTRW